LIAPTTTVQATALQGVLQKLQIFKKNAGSGPEGGRGGSSNFGQRAIWRRQPGDRTRSLE
jgi:hypothetical protein